MEEEIININDDTDSNITQATEAVQEQNNTSADIKECLISYIKIDDLIKEMMEQIKTLKDKKKTQENIIIMHLETNNASHFDIPGGKLIKEAKESKTPINTELIKESIKEGITDQTIDRNAICDTIIDLIEQKRDINRKTTIKRTFDKKIKPKAKRILKKK
jgi:hypothetical protein